MTNREAWGTALGVLAVGMLNLVSGASTLLLARSPTVAGVLGMVATALAIGVVLYFGGRLIGRQ